MDVAAEVVEGENTTHLAVLPRWFLTENERSSKRVRNQQTYCFGKVLSLEKVLQVEIVKATLQEIAPCRRMNAIRTKAYIDADSKADKEEMTACQRNKDQNKSSL